VEWIELLAYSKAADELREAYGAWLRLSNSPAA
jgi:hypothetical protein